MPYILLIFMSAKDTQDNAIIMTLWIGNGAVLKSSSQ